MTAKTTAPKYDSQTSKDEEIAALIAFRAQFDEGTYIADFLDEKTIVWVSGMIKNDFPPSLRENLEGQIADEQSGRLVAEMDAAKTRDEVSKLTAKIANLTATVDRQSGTIEQLERMNRDAEGRFIDKCEQVLTLENDIKLIESNRDAQIAKLNRKIADLKAEIYDLKFPEN